MLDRLAPTAALATAVALAPHLAAHAQTLTGVAGGSAVGVVQQENASAPGRAYGGEAVGGVGQPLEGAFATGFANQVFGAASWTGEVTAAPGRFSANGSASANGRQTDRLTFDHTQPIHVTLSGLAELNVNVVLGTPTTARGAARFSAQTDWTVTASASQNGRQVALDVVAGAGFLGATAFQNGTSDIGVQNPRRTETLAPTTFRLDPGVSLGLQTLFRTTLSAGGDAGQPLSRALADGRGTVWISQITDVAGNPLDVGLTSLSNALYAAPTSIAVPEPAAGVVLAAGLLCVRRRRTRSVA